MLMNLEILNLSSLASPWTYVVFVIQCAVAWAGVRALYHVFGLDIWDPRLRPFEAKFWVEWGRYTVWALFQQAIVIVGITALDAPYLVSVLAAIVMFAVLFHVPNWRLMATTAVLGAVLYPVFFAGYSSGVLMAIIHAFGGVCYARAGFEMRVWRF